MNSLFKHPNPHIAAPGLTIEPESDISPEQIVALARSASRAGLQLSDASRKQMLRSCAALDRLLENGEDIYGETTGFGPHVRYARGEAGSETHGRHLLEHLAAGAGETTPPEVVRATIALRTLTMARGYSAVRPEILEAYAKLLELEEYPAVPVLGSVGASGDLVPLAHIARAATGQGKFCAPATKANTSDADGEDSANKANDRFRLRAATDVLNEHGLEAIQPRAREALAMSNGVSYSAAWALFALCDAKRLLRRAEELTAMIYAALGASRSALDPMLHQARGHDHQSASAAHIREHLQAYARDTKSANDANNTKGAATDDRNPDRPLQEVYSLRCVPQIAGAARAQLAHAEQLLHAEINGVSDNPVIYYDESDQPRVAHGGNFFGQQIAFASDAINQATTQLGLLVERQIALLCNPAQNSGAPLLLAGTQGLDSGLAGAQLTATAVVAEMRLRCQSAATATIPTNGDNQDIVSMSTIAARSAREQNDRLATVLAILAIAIRQLAYLRESGQAPGDAILLPEWLATIAPLPHDRALQDDIARLSAVMPGED
ncbi:MAG: aromatic amino acid ammonia-lyase [bacterium]|nr:aromatic amino acid ammonia-lyase [bacterium]